MPGFRAACRARTLVPIVALVGVLAAGCGKKEPPPIAKGPVEVTVVTVAPRDVPAAFEYVGQTQSSRASVRE